MTTEELIVAISDWLDEGKGHLDPMHLLHIRTSKLQEELGEVQDAVIGVVIKRLHPQDISGTEQMTFAPVPDGESKVADDLL